MLDMEARQQVFTLFWDDINKGFPIEVVSRWCDAVVSKYRESQRYYHTLQHVLDMWDLKQKHCHDLDKPRLVDYAIIFHDVIYDPMKQNNEELSAELFKEFAKEISLCEGDTALVVDWILCTKTHSTPQHQQSENSAATTDLHYFLDLDMSILGAAPQVYQEYAENIRKEYGHIPQEEYCRKRPKVLEDFLQQGRIYATDTFYELYEEQARKNIQQEITSLREIFCSD